MQGASPLPYRPCVGILLFEPHGRVWLGRRVPKWDGDVSRHMWQMPQGGIDARESPRQAAFRELKEEVGTDKAEIAAESRQWLSYDLPQQALGVALQGKYRGQRQKWFAMRFLGEDSDIDIGRHPDRDLEFDAWRWADLDEALELVVPFKRPVYDAVAREFAPLLADATGDRRSL